MYYTPALTANKSLVCIINYILSTNITRVMINSTKKILQKENKSHVVRFRDFNITKVISISGNPNYRLIGRLK
jgi:hypothetical protein